MKTRLPALAIVATLFAGACSGTTEPNAATTSTTESAAATNADGTEPAAAEEGDDGPGSDLVAPTLATGPWDLSDGAVRSDEGVQISPDGPAGLPSDVAQATAPWPTDWTRRTVELAEFDLGIQAVDPRDRIPPIDEPRFEPIANADWLGEREPGALVRFNGETRFYPLSILTRHEIVNDRFGDIPVIVTFCPLCNTALAFDARVDGAAARFGVSGLLRNSDLVMWDEATTTLWQQVTGEGLVGEFAGTTLIAIPTSIVSYEEARDSFPDALSLSSETGFGIAYGANSYVDYSTGNQPFLFFGELDDRFPALSRVVGVTVDEQHKGYPFGTISTERAINDEVGTTPIVVLWGGDTADALAGQVIADNEAIGTGIAFDRRVGDQILTLSSIDDDLFTDAETGTTWTLLGAAIEGPLAGEQLETVVHRNEFWFAWAAFFPEAPVYVP